MDTAIMLPVVKQQPAFNGFQFSIIELHGRQMFVATEVGRALGYSDDGRVLSRLIRKEWAEQLDEGEDYIILTGEPLKLLNGIMVGKTNPDPGDVVTRRNKLMLLTEEGLYAVMGLTNKPAGKAFRRYVARVLLPSARRAAVPEISPSPDVAQLTRRLDEQERIVDRLTLALNKAGIHVPPPSAISAVATDARETFARFVAWCRGAGRPRLHITGEPTPPMGCLVVLDGADVYFGAEALTTAMGMNATALARSWVDAGLLELPAGYDGRLNSAKWAKYVPALGTRKMFRARLDGASCAG